MGPDEVGRGRTRSDEVGAGKKSWMAGPLRRLGFEMRDDARRLWGWALATWVLAGCYRGVAGDAQVAADADDGASGADDGDDAGGDDGGDDDDGDAPDAACDETAGPIALRYLTRVEYENTIRDLFGETMDVTAAFAPDESVGGYFANSTQAPSSTQLEMFLDTAQTLAQVVVEDRLERFVECQPDEAGCAQTFIAEFGRRAFRRPLTDDEMAAYASTFETIAAEQEAALGLQVVAAAMLASPHFLYVGQRMELTDPQARAYDLASRLSYFVWATMSDEVLMEAAESGDLATRQGIEAQVRRMLEDERAADMLASFSSQWLDVGSLEQSAPKHPEQFPQWTPELVAAAERETAELMQHVVLEGDARFSTLLQSRKSYVDAPLASLYGVAPPAAGAGWVELPAGERAGLLTRAAFLARHAHATENSWVHRGKVVRERLLCGTLPPPPPIADDSPINDASRLEDPQCSGCHLLMDPIGVGFDEYDPIGAFEAGAAPGRIEGIDDPEFDGAIDLSDRLAASTQAQQCFATQMFGYANRRAIESGDACTVQALGARFAETEGDIVELIVALATADAFTGLEGE